MWKRTLIIKIAAIALLIGLAVVCIGVGSSPKPDNWQTSSITDSGTVADCPLGSVLVGDPKQAGPDIAIHMVDTLCRDQECRIVAVGTDGQTHIATTDVKTNPRQTCRSTIAVFAGLNIEDIDQFKFQKRPRRKNIPRAAYKPKISNAATKKRLIDQACENRLFESNYIN